MTLKILKLRIHFLFFLYIFLSLSSLQAEVYYPWKEVYAGALDNRAWAGLVFMINPTQGFAFRFRLNKNGEVADNLDWLDLVAEVGPHSPDGQYARMKFDVYLPFQRGAETPLLIKPPPKGHTLTLEWSRLEEKTIVGRLEAPSYINLHLIHYFPWNLQGIYRALPSGEIIGESGGSSKQYYFMWIDKPGLPISPGQGTELIHSFPMDRHSPLYFVAGVESDPDYLVKRLFRYRNARTIDAFLAEEADRYQRKRVKIEGLYEGVPEAITNNIFWTILYQAGYHRFYCPAGRKWIFPSPKGEPDDWTIFEWDSFFNALEAAVESTFQAKQIVEAVLETQYPHGNIPNWRSRTNGTPDRSQPPVGAYIVLKLFLKTGDFDFLCRCYPYLRNWHAFWRSPGTSGLPRRDGNNDGLLEWGSDAELVPARKFPTWEENASGKQRAMWESGQDDLPNWDEAGFNETTGTLTMNCLDLNCLYALDAWSLAQIARFLQEPAAYEEYMKEYERLRALINQHFWNESEGFYFDRHWNGHFSKRKAASNFYPLLAKIPDEARAQKMIRRLLNPKEFWGDFVIPTISRDDPAFKDQQYWRGTIWPPTNYLLYQGLKAYGFDTIASEFAKKSANLFLRAWKTFQICPENFDARTGEPGGQKFQSWGPLFALIALEEYLDFTPWEGFRFGMIAPEKEGRLSRLAIQGRHYEVEVSRKKIVLREEGKEIVRTNGGAVFRQFLYSDNEVSFTVNTLDERKIKINFIKKGKYQLMLDNLVQRIFRGEEVTFRVPAGNHSVSIFLLEGD